MEARSALCHISSLLELLEAIDHFRGSEHGVLLATDVAARGLDIPGVCTVVHYQLPHSIKVRHREEKDEENAGGLRLQEVLSREKYIVLDAVIQIILLENVQNHRKIRTKEHSSEVLGVIVVEYDDEKAKDKPCLVAQASNEICLGVDLEPDEWIKDSGFSKHMTGNRKLFSTYKAYNGGQICDNKCRITFSENDSEITKDGKIIGREMLKKFGLEDSKPMKTPMSSDTKLTKDEECESVDSTKYRGMIGTIDLSKNPAQHSQTKHIEIHHHFLRDNVQKGHIAIENVPSVDNIFDILTKPLKRESFNYLRLGLGMMEHIP
ncbi:copia protein [Tanacetum coccineum]|uniref:Copia protein n=1 Tax=Tanacetum coccineum TaxID=301880 RepID=A0ABQ4WKF1_9ASTR